MASSPSLADPVTPQLERLRGFAGGPGEFWPLFLEVAGGLTSAAVISLHARVEPAENGSSWRQLLERRTPGATGNRIENEPPPTILETALTSGTAIENLTGAWAAVRVSAGSEGGTGVLAFGFANPDARKQAWSTMLLLAEVPVQYLASRESADVRHRNEELVGALDLSLMVDRQRKFPAAAMTVCNEVATRFGCDRVSLGWLGEDQIIRLRAVSHAEKFEQKAQIVRWLELAMEECLDQDTDVQFPPRDGTLVTRDHATYARETGASHLLSLPLRVDARSVGVVLCERESAVFAELEIRRMRLALDQVVRRLEDFEERGHWFGRRSWRWLKREARMFFEPRETGFKIAVVVGCLALAYLLFGRLPYRVGATCVLRSEQVNFVTAPFDGFVQDVAVRVGDNVPAGGLLTRFDTRELLLQQASALANVSRHQQEAEKARAADSLADMRIAQAEGDQARAELDQTRYHLEQAEIKAPFAAAVVEGDLRKRIGSPFRQGEVLFQLARLDALYVELEIPERDAHDILNAHEAVITLASAPDREFKVTIEQVHPSAQSRPAGSVFLARAQRPENAPVWWRPGMTGVARIKAGWRNPLWMLTHRTLDWVRLHLWW